MQSIVRIKRADTLIINKHLNDSVLDHDQNMSRKDASQVVSVKNTSVIKKKPNHRSSITNSTTKSLNELRKWRVSLQSTTRLNSIIRRGGISRKSSKAADVRRKFVVIKEPNRRNNETLFRTKKSQRKDNPSEEAVLVNAHSYANSNGFFGVLNRFIKSRSTDYFKQITSSAFKHEPNFYFHNTNNTCNESTRNAAHLVLSTPILAEIRRHIPINGDELSEYLQNSV